MRRPIIAGNWKMHKTINEAIELANGLKRNLFDIKDIEIVICAPFTALSEVSEIILESNIQLGAQDMYWENQGAFTGEISGLMLKDAGAKYVIIGHSERRQYFGETDTTVNKKIKAAVSLELIPILCIGETISEREANKTYEVLEKQIQHGLKDIDILGPENFIIAYEPVWAIGTGKTATVHQAQGAQKFIRDLLIKIYNKDTAEGIRIQYGGSVKPQNSRELMQQPDIDGALVGGASLELDSFVKIIRNSQGAK